MRHLDVFARQAAAQYGLLTLRQLRQQGSTDKQIERLVRRGLIRSRRRGLYELVGSTPCWEQDVLAACLSADRLSAASHRSGIRLWGMRTVDDEVEISIRYPAQLRSPGIIVHRSRDLSEHDVTYIDAIPVTTPVRTLCDAGLIFPDHEVERMTHFSLAKRLVTPADLWRYRRRVGRQGRTGVGPLERVLERLPPDVDCADSGPEIAMRALCEEYGLPVPVWQHPVVACGRHYRIDFAYPGRRVAIEYDEFEPHTRPDVFANDRQRQNDLIASGWVVLRFTWPDLRDRPGDVARRIRLALDSVTI